MDPNENTPRVERATEPSLEPQGLAEANPLRPGVKVGRFVVVSELGKGGMGAVYAAFDPQLNRKVAVKILHPEAAAIQGSEATARLLREAQALARISHPNVVSVHDVGMHEGGVFIAMEFVEGITLSEWLPGKTRSEILKAFDAAGQGLQAVHQAGLVHRDFKASNVLVATDGRIKLLDLGLARLSVDRDNSSSPSLQTPISLSEGESSGSLDNPLTQFGQVTGTPGYIALEILKGETATPQSDQFSFGVALYKALVGKQPFKSRTMEAYTVALRKGPPAAPPPEAKVPKWLFAVVLRSLNENPEARFASMNEMLQALRSDPTRTRLRRAVFASIAAMLMVAVYGVIRVTDSGCQTKDQLLRELWPKGSLQRFEAQMTAQRPGMASVIRRGLSILDERIHAWAVAHETTCRSVHPRFSPVIASRRMSCLERHQQEFQVLVQTLAHADSLTVSKSAELIGGSTVDPECVGRVDRRTADDVPAEKAALARQMRFDLFRAKSLYLSAKYHPAQAVALQVAEAAHGAEIAGFEAEARYLASQISLELGESEASNRDLRSAMRLALGAGMDEIALRSTVTLTQRLSDHKDRLPQAKELAEVAESLFTRLGSPADLEIEIAFVRVDIAYAENRKADMVAHAQRKVEAAKKEFGEFSVEHGEALGQHSYALWQADRVVDSTTLSGRAIQVLEGTLGTDDPRLVWYYRLHGDRLAATGRDEEVGPLFERALKLARLTLDADSKDTPNIMVSLADHLSENDPQRAFALVNEAIQWYEKAQLPSRLSRAYRVRSRVLSKLHRGADALADCDRSRTAEKGLSDVDSWRILSDARCRGNAYFAMNQFTDAVAAFDRAKKLPKAKAPSERAALALEYALARRAMNAPFDEARAMCKEGLSEIEFFPPTSFVKRNLLTLLNSLPVSPTGRGTAQITVPNLELPPVSGSEQDKH